MIDVLELYSAPEGRYVGANDRALTVLGYTVEELVALPPGGVSRSDPEVVLEIWTRFVAGEIDIPGDRVSEIVTKSGEVLPVIFLGVVQDRADGCYTARLRLVSPGVVLNKPKALHVILAAWRAAEARLEAMPADAPGRADLALEIAGLRQVYRSEADRAKGRTTT